jgi:tetratricopeptide (TPR) repeat protein
MRTPRSVSLLMALVLAILPALASATEPAVSDPDVQKGVKQVDEGDYDAAIFTLDSAARRLAGDPAKVADLSQAYLYLGIAYMGKGHQAAAHAKFREAVQQIRDISLSPDRFPPKVIDALEAARAEVRKAPAVPATATTATAPEKKGGKKGLLILGGVAVLGGGAAVALGGGGDGGGDSGPSDTRRLETFTGTLCGSYEVCGEYGREYQIVVTTPGTLEATVTWGNSNIFFYVELQDENYETVARSNRITNTSSSMTSAVTPRTSSPSASYRIWLGRGDGGAATDNYTLTVRHP